MPQESAREEPVRDILDEPPSPIYEPTSDEEQTRPAAIARAVEEAKDPADRLFAAVTRQLSRAEIMGREDSLKAIQKEFNGIGAMGAWKLESVREGSDVREEAIREQKTIHIADLLAICSEKNVYRVRAIKEILEGQSVLQRRRSQGRERQPCALSDLKCITSIHRSRKRHDRFRHVRRTQGDLSRCSESILASVVEKPCKDVDTPAKTSMAEGMVQRRWHTKVQKASD